MFPFNNNTCAGIHWVNTGNYNLNSNLPAAGANNSVTIAPASLTIQVNHAAIFATQDASTAPDMGLSYTGLVNGETAATALTSSVTRTFDNSQTNNTNTPTAGTYTNAFDLSTTPTATNGNYSITVNKGTLTVVPADKLMITITSQSDTYGNRTSANEGVASVGTVTAQYCFDQSLACSGSNIASLAMTRLSDTQWRAADNTGSFVVFDTGISATSFSGGGYLQVGNYTYTATEIAPLSLFTNGVANFNGRYTNGGVLTVEPLTVNPTLSASDKTYDGNTSVTLSTSISALSGDSLSFDHVSASFDSASVGENKTVTVYGVQLQGADAANYRLAGPSLSTFANILALPTPTPEPTPSPFIPAINPSIPSTGGFGSSAFAASEGGGMTASLDNPFQLSTDDPGQCRVDNLEACGCDTTGPEPDLDICYQRFVSAP